MAEAQVARAHTPTDRNIPNARGINLFTGDPGFASRLRAYLGKTIDAGLGQQLIALGRRAAEELDDGALTADQHPPKLVNRTRRGGHVQRLDKHPAYTALEQLAYGELGLAAYSHTADQGPSLIKYALTFIFVQAEFGVCCPVSMTDSLTRTLRQFADPKLVARAEIKQQLLDETPLALADAMELLP